MINLPEIEKKILSFWQKKDIFKKSLDKKSPQGPSSAIATAGRDFVFYDGPPFATGTPHYGHIVASLMKDIIPRYQTMKGFHVERKWGWDCHGLPIENIVEEEMKVKSKKDIEQIGIDKFNETCRSKVLLYAKEWRQVIERLGRWVDMDNDYKTMDKDYMESIWWVFKQLWDEGLIYQGYKSMHICPRCETTLSQSEVTQGYKDVEDVSVTVKFKIKTQNSTNKNQVFDNSYILAWTTTPWTLIGNVALAVGEKIDYVLIRQNNQNYILAKNCLESVLGENKYEILSEFKGKELEGLEYEPLFDYYLTSPKGDRNWENFYTVQTADFVSTEDGTGVVHIAPAFGEEDMLLGQEKNLPFIQHVSMDGRIKDEAVDFAGLEVKPKKDPLLTDRKILDHLAKKDLVFKEFKYSHSYPHCWRCESPLLNYATSSWFVNVEKIKDQALKTSKSINWVPAHIKQGRFGKWLEGARDWSISRQRFWGSVMPIWQCVGADKGGSSPRYSSGHKLQINAEKGCGHMVVVGSVEELEKLSGQKVEDLHKHFVDKITFKCEKCDGQMQRIPDVLDCWFESGSMPYAQVHYPFENKQNFEKNFPAEFIAEGVDQTSCWFYYLHILANAIKKSQAFKNVIVNGIVLAEDGKKMSKKLQNYPDPMEIMDKYGADAVRYYLATSQVMKAENLNFTESEVDEVVKKVLLILVNVFSFYKMYASNTNIDANKFEYNANDFNNVLDKWILAKIESLKNQITKAYDSYDLVKASRPIAEFVNDLSTWYLRRSRERFKSEGSQDREQALKTTGYVFLELVKVMAPVMPFISDYIYQEIGRPKESVHLEDWPEVKENLIDQKVLDYMQTTRKLVEMALAKRAEAQIKVRQPLQELRIINYELSKEYLDLVRDEVNVKKVVCKKGTGDLAVELSLEISLELKQEGILRELIRTINQMRKKAGLTIADRIEIKYHTQDKLTQQVFIKFKNELLTQTLADKIEEAGEGLEKIKINGVEVGIQITSS